VGILGAGEYSLSNPLSTKPAVQRSFSGSSSKLLVTYKRHTIAPGGSVQFTVDLEATRVTPVRFENSGLILVIADDHTGQGDCEKPLPKVVAEDPTSGKNNCNFGPKSIFVESACLLSCSDRSV
jgi:hypothetical protein